MSKLPVLLLFVSMFFGCTHRNNNTDTLSPGTLQITISHSVDGQQLIWDSIMYKNDAGNRYGISKLQYYISNVRLYNNMRVVHHYDSVYYIDAKYQYSSVVSISGVSAGAYDSVALTIGLLPFRNKSYSLPATIENTGMNWPDVMGGGYHFLKLEGHWLDTAIVNGFALHVGKSGFHCEAGFPCHLEVKSTQITNLSIGMNINEWFRTPSIYNFSTDGVYSMGDELMMRKIITNGQDVFSEMN